MSERFIKYIPSEKARWLMKQNNHAFCLLCEIASRANRTNDSFDGLEIGEAYVGDWESYGMSRQNYRTSLDLLCKLNIIKKVESNRTCKKSTIGITTRGTKVKLLNSDIWDINLEIDNHLGNHCLTTAQPLPNHVQEIKEIKESKKASSAIFFDRSSSNFVGITQADRDAWQTAFPQVNIDRELLLMRSWLLTEKGQIRKGTRQFIDKWLNQCHAITPPKIIQPESKECEIDPFVKAKVKERYHEVRI